ncbi:Uncharacterised protein [Klebsiella pneumoniae]|nr:Uncharacterised protein [Klebsiella pneumoniae]
MAKCAARFQSELSALHNCPEETGLVTCGQFWDLADLCSSDARKAVGCHVLWKSQRHLSLNFWICEQASQSGRFIAMLRDLVSCRSCLKCVGRHVFSLLHSEYA